MPITHSQQKFLKDRLQAIRLTKPRQYEAVELPEPNEVKAARATVVAAQRIIDRFHAKRENAKNKRNAAVDKMINACNRAIFFGEPKAALKALDAFEAKEF